jgi:hypothetical protein
MSERNHRSPDNAPSSEAGVPRNSGTERRIDGGACEDKQGQTEAEAKEEFTSQRPDADAKVRFKTCSRLLRKLIAVCPSRCLQHPFLCNNALEDYSLGPTERHQALIDGSAKLGFLKAMLPKLRAKGHRVLLFSQVGLLVNLLES